MTPLEAFKQQYKETRERKAKIEPFLGYLKVEQSQPKEKESKWYSNKWDKINTVGFKTQSYLKRKIKEHYVDLFGLNFYEQNKHRISFNTGRCFMYLRLEYRDDRVMAKGNNFIPVKVFNMMRRRKLKEKRKNAKKN